MNKRYRFLPFVCCLVLFFSFRVSSSIAQSRYPTPSIDVVSTDFKGFKIDGALDEAEWAKHRVIGDFWQYFPTDTLRAKSKAEVYMAYDDSYLYVAAKCYTPSQKYVIPSLRRDYRAGGNDNISFVFDTFLDKTNAFLFGINPEGVMREALISNGGSDTQFFNTFWDNKWEGNSKKYDGYWTCELKIPFKTLRYKEGSKQWNFMCYWFNTQSNEQASWVRIPQNQLIFNLAFTGPMNFDKPLRKPGPNLALIPYLRGGQTTDFSPKEPNRLPQNTVGLDAKVGITPALILDATINPDFSTVEADRQVQNLTRFDISLAFPEQRQFFLENSDLFGTFGSQEIIPSAIGNPNFTPFFTRRVGLEIDTTTGTYTPNRILYGARLNGKIGNDWRVGLLNIETQQEAERGISGANTTVAVLQRKLFSRSNLTALLVNKETRDPSLSSRLTAYNRVAGLEYNLASRDNRWQGKFYYHQGFTPSLKNDKAAAGGSLIYNVLRYQFSLSGYWIGDGFEAEAGVVPRRNVWRIAPQALFNFYPRTRFLNRYNVGLTYEQYRMPILGMTDQAFGLAGETLFQNTARFNWQLTNNFTYLFTNFDPTRSGKTPLKAGTNYRYTNLQFVYLSDQRQKVSLQAQGTLGQNFDGHIVSLTGAVLYRFQPFGTLTGNFSYSRISSAAGTGTLFLIGPRTDITFTKSVFWTTFLQYNSLTNNVNVNSRVQWRFKPVSDLFLVYSDNYFADSFLVKNRAIIAKITYWLNL